MVDQAGTWPEAQVRPIQVADLKTKNPICFPNPERPLNSACLHIVCSLILDVAFVKKQKADAAPASRTIHFLTW